MFEEILVLLEGIVGHTLVQNEQTNAATFSKSEVMPLIVYNPVELKAMTTVEIDNYLTNLNWQLNTTILNKEKERFKELIEQVHVELKSREK